MPPKTRHEWLPPVLSFELHQLEDPVPARTRTLRLNVQSVKLSVEALVVGSGKHDHVGQVDRMLPSPSTRSNASESSLSLQR